MWIFRTFKKVGQIKELLPIFEKNGQEKVLFLKI
jgi:hypothetical protein